MRFLPALALLFAAAFAGTAQAQAPATVYAFPADAVKLGDAELRAQVTGTTYVGTPESTKERWRLQYKDGFVWITTSRNFQDSGKWKVENGLLCIAWNRNPNGGCSEVRFIGKTMYLAWRNEVVELKVD